jgi:hypothetical protein
LRIGVFLGVFAPLKKKHYWVLGVFFERNSRPEVPPLKIATPRSQVFLENS